MCGQSKPVVENENYEIEMTFPVNDGETYIHPSEVGVSSPWPASAPQEPTQADVDAFANVFGELLGWRKPRVHRVKLASLKNDDPFTYRGILYFKVQGSAGFRAARQTVRELQPDILVRPASVQTSYVVTY